MKSLIAIDPGVNGSIAVSNDGEITTHLLPRLDLEIYSAITGLFPAKIVYVERVPSFAGNNIPGSRAFALGFSYGVVCGVLAGSRQEFVTVPPQTWMKQLNIPARGKRTHAEWKRFLKNEAQRLFPAVKVTLQNADSLLILRFALLSENLK